MSKANRASDTPYRVQVEAGKTYFWCACGQSTTQPFCDGSHKGTEFTPIKYQALATKNIAFCGCKASNTPPLCDGSHKSDQGS